MATWQDRRKKMQVHYAYIKWRQRPDQTSPPTAKPQPRYSSGLCN
jgi:hypothetical protein